MNLLSVFSHVKHRISICGRRPRAYFGGYLSFVMFIIYGAALVAREFAMHTPAYVDSR